MKNDLRIVRLFLHDVDYRYVGAVPKYYREERYVCLLYEDHTWEDIAVYDIDFYKDINKVNKRLYFGNRIGKSIKTRGQAIECIDKFIKSNKMNGKLLVQKES